MQFDINQINNKAVKTTTGLEVTILTTTANHHRHNIKLPIIGLIHTSECSTVLKEWTIDGETMEYLMNRQYDSSNLTLANNWDNNIPEKGVLCWVSDDNEYQKTRTAIIVKKEQNDGGYYTTNTKLTWSYATPLTKAEALELIYDEQ